MTYEQYWKDDPILTEIYRKADKLNRDRENERLWLQGMYFYDALCCVSPIFHAFAKSGTKPVPYPSRPYAITKEDAEKRKQEEEKKNREKAIAAFAAWAENLKIDDKEGTSNGN